MRLFVGAVALLATLAFAVGVYSAGGLTGGGPGAASQVRITSAGRTLATMSARRAAFLAAGGGSLPVAPSRTVRIGRARVTYRVGRSRLRSQLGVTSRGGGTVELPERAIASRIEVPVIRQDLRNNCETAALSMLLASVGVAQDQLSLQRQIRVDGPLDPIQSGGKMIWGDPDRGFVGRADGGGTAGGFGVYEQPIADLASRWTHPTDLTGQAAGVIYQRLLQGRAVLAWVGLGSGPYRSWTTEQGRAVTVNLDEHAVLLIGIGGGRLLVNDPLDGQRKWWTMAQFESMWTRLGRRAISV